MTRRRGMVQGELEKVAKVRAEVTLVRLDILCWENKYGYLYKNQRAYLAIPVGDMKGLMILKNVLLCFKTSYGRDVQISPRFL